jgi:hypothetical protein
MLNYSDILNLQEKVFQIKQFIFNLTILEAVRIQKLRHFIQ